MTEKMFDRIKQYLRTSFPYSKKTFLFLALSVMVLAAVFGFLWEQLYGVIWPDGKAHHGTSFGPWIQLYGFGALAVFLLCRGLRKKPLAAILSGTLICVAAEYMTAFCMDRFLHWRAWDYREGPFRFGNVQGYVALIPALMIAAGIAAFFYVLIPALEKFCRKVGEDRALKIISVPAALFLLDVLYNDILAGPLGLYSASMFYNTPR